MRQIVCPVCSSKPPIDHPEENDLVDCQVCGVTWTYLGNELDAEALYSDEVYAVVDNRKSIFERIIFWEAKRVLKEAEGLIHTSSRKLLDFGSGKGQFLLVAKERSWDALGIETAVERAEFAREKYKVKVLSQFYYSGPIQDGEFAMISLNHVLEHLEAPFKLVKNLIVCNLNRKGVVYIEVPRRNSWQSILAGKHWMHWDIPKHLTHWSEDELVAQMRKIGMKKVKERRFSIHLGVLGMLQAIFSFCGYRSNLILSLKRKKSLGLFLGILIGAPFAFLLEGIASIFSRGGILGVYFELDDKR